MFDKFQSGFRKMHSTETALLKVSSDIRMAADSGQFSVLILLDLSAAFDTVDHKLLLQRLNTDFGISGTVLKWLSSYLTNRTFSVCINNIMSEATPLLHGVPQGSVLGPILFLLYISPLGKTISRFKNVSYHLYADDIQLYFSFKESEMHRLSELMDCLSSVKLWLRENCLQLNSKKTETLIIAPEQKIPSIVNHLGSLGSSVQSSIRNLGVWFDQSLSLDSHSRHLAKNCFFHLRNFAKLRPILSKSDLELVIHAFISSRLDYCNSLFTCFNKSALNRLQMVQNAAARLLTGSSRRSHITPILSSLHWLPIKFRIELKILVLTFRALHGQAPKYVSDLLCPYSSGRTLRSSGQNLLTVPRTHFKTRGDLSFEAVAPKLWNDLPLWLRVTDTVDSFKQQLKTWLFGRAFS
uniref:Reverse transcriptase domain-containing protein n=1 Tax=Neogobius melanostomus TaxID=47308 RepID=A0A8C6TLJ0_9GOBI